MPKASRTRSMMGRYGIALALGRQRPVRNVARSLPETQPKLAQETRLPHARLAEDPDHLARPVLGARQPIVEHRHVAVPPHESAQRAAAHLEAAALRSDRARCRRWPSVRASLGPSSKRRSRWGARRGATRRSCPGRRRRAAHRARSRAARRSRASICDDLAARRDQAPGDVDGPAPVARALARIAPERGAGGQRGVRGPARPVLPGVRAERRDHAERRELLDAAAERLHRGQELLEQRARGRRARCSRSWPRAMAMTVTSRRSQRSAFGAAASRAGPRAPRPPSAAAAARSSSSARGRGGPAAGGVSAAGGSATGGSPTGVARRAAERARREESIGRPNFWTCALSVLREMPSAFAACGRCSRPCWSSDGLDVVAHHLVAGSGPGVRVPGRGARRGGGGPARPDRSAASQIEAPGVHAGRLHHERRALHHVRELPDVARPRVVEEPPPRVGRQGARRADRTRGRPARESARPG